ncbi:MAG TPA: U32 family peptidase [Clostridia bacterium]|nr:U32 family peptidase [Clostridia bacterium]
MARFFNGKKVELLAPAGTMETFEKMVKANCDAIYLGGKSLNMRMIRKGYNLTDEEITEAVKMAHEENKKVYVTVNNMLNEYETDEAAEYLHFLDSINADGILVQDTSILKLCREQKLNRFEIHASVMMNVHNIESVKALQEFGVSRVVLSREMGLETAKNLQNSTGIETEYFMHGDMCTVNGANCYYSSLLWGNSSNRGRCFKPCRWQYKIKKDGKLYPTEYPLAAKDMYMYEHIPELIGACVTSFKIEGRMRETDFIVDLVNTYGEAIDRYIKDPLSYDRKKQARELYENRKRDFTTAYAFGKPGLDFINTRYEGTGKFYSTGKVFSVPSEEPEITPAVLAAAQNELDGVRSDTCFRHNLSVKVNNYDQARLCIEAKVSRIYISSEVLQPGEFMTVEQLEHLAGIKGGTELYLALPQMMNELQFDIIDHYLDNYGQLYDGLLLSNIGAIREYGGKFKLVTDYNLNIYNHRALDFYKSLGVAEFTASIEAKSNELAEFISLSQGILELIVHGPIRVMYLDHNLYDNVKALQPVSEADNKYVDNDILVMMTDKGENPVYIDQNGKNHLFTSKELCLLPLLPYFDSDKPVNFRIEGQTYSLEELKYVIDIYHKAISDKSECAVLYERMKSCRAGFTLGALSYKFGVD